jgi:hypothetical protein
MPTMNERATPEHAAARHILSSPSIAARCAPYIGEDGFDWPRLLVQTETMSGGEQLLVRIAFDLWEAKGLVGIWELPRCLDRESFRRVLDALAICRGELPAGGPAELAHAA